MSTLEDPNTNSAVIDSIRRRWMSAIETVFLSSYDDVRFVGFDSFDVADENLVYIRAKSSHDRRRLVSAVVHLST